MLDDFQFRKYYLFITMFIMKKHTIVNRKVSYSLLIEDFPLIREYNRMVIVNVLNNFSISFDCYNYFC